MALRTPLSVTPHLYMGDSTGRPLDKGVVYFGEQDKDPEFYPITLYSDDALTLPLAQPVHTKGGYLYDKGDMVEPHAKEIIYSVKVLDSYGRKVFYKGAMMRNSWNDDVIQQINEAVIGSADVARQVATDITNEAINNTAVEDGVLADTFLTVTPNSLGTVARNQRDKNSEIVSVHDFGVCGNGANDTVVIQSAIQKLSDIARADGKPRTLTLVAGKTYIVKDLRLYPMVDLVCLGGAATLKRPDVPESVPESEAKWWRVLTVQHTAWSTPEDYAHRVKLRNITIDGNLENARWSGGYSQEQASNLILNSAGFEDAERRPRFLIDSVTFRNSVSDGLHIVSNVDVRVRGCEAYDCFRGGLVITGGNSVVDVDGWYAESACFDMEVDSGGSAGDNKTFDSYISIKNYISDPFSNSGVFKKGFDLSGLGSKSTLILNNVRVYGGGLYWYMGGTDWDKTGNHRGLQVTDCTFLLYRQPAPIYNPVAGILKNVTFIINNSPPTDWDGTTPYTCRGIRFYTNYNGVAAPSDYLLLDNIRFELLDKSADAVKPDYLIATENYVITTKTVLKLTNSDFSNVSVKSGGSYIALYGGRMELDNIAYNSPECLLSLRGANDLVDMPIKITIGNILFGEQCERLLLLGMHPYSNLYTKSYGNVLNFKDLVVPKNVTLPYLTHTGFHSSLREAGIGNMVRILDRSPTDSDRGFEGDIIKLNAPIIGKPHEWVKLNTNLSSSGHEWRAIKWTTGKFATTALPTLSKYDVGVVNYDTTLSKFVTWTGTAWV